MTSQQNDKNDIDRDTGLYSTIDEIVREILPDKTPAQQARNEELVDALTRAVMREPIYGLEVENARVALSTIKLSDGEIHLDGHGDLVGVNCPAATAIW